MDSFARIPSRRERRAAASVAPRHRHEQAYAAVVLSGSYEECGSSGRYRVGPGDVLFHDVFEAHLDRFGAGGAEIVNLALTARPAARAGRLSDADEFARLAGADREAALAYLLEHSVHTGSPADDWPDRLAADLQDDPELRLDDWAACHDLSAETVSRGFGRLYGVAPCAYRAGARARLAFDKIVRSGDSLAEIAALTGHADQSHMTRAVKALTGITPNRWRRSNPFKTEFAGAAKIGA